MSKMRNVYRRYALAGATLSVAVSIGFLMQSGDQGSFAHAAIAPVTAKPVSSVHKASLSLGIKQEQTNPTGPDALPLMPAEMPPQSDLPSEPVVLVVSRDAPLAGLPSEERTPLLGCESSLTAEPMAAASVRLMLMSPCHAGDRVTILHSGLKLTERVSPDGSLSIIIPALTQAARFAVAFPNGDGVIAQADVPAVAFYDRVIVQWTGQTGMQLHAYEFGAEHGDDGHVWQMAARDLTVVSEGAGGFLVRLGNPELQPAHTAEIYTFPSKSSWREGLVKLSVEVDISEANCGQDVFAQMIQQKSGQKPILRDLEVAVPDCDAIGEILVLKNIYEDLKIARN